MNEPVIFSSLPLNLILFHLNLRSPRWRETEQGVMMRDEQQPRSGLNQSLWDYEKVY